jgi:hypothetical protein
MGNETLSDLNRGFVVDVHETEIGRLEWLSGVDAKGYPSSDEKIRIVLSGCVARTAPLRCADAEGLPRNCIVEHLAKRRNSKSNARLPI